MSLQVAVQMDPIESISIRGDSTFALMLEAQARKHPLFCFEPSQLSFLDGALKARGRDVEVRDEAGNHFSAGEQRHVNLSAFDVVLMRQDPPFDMKYITASHLLEHLHPKTLVVNDPVEVRNAPEKLFLLRYSDLMPPTLITRDVEELRRFRNQHGDIILKPLYGNGGAGVFRQREGDENFAALTELFLQMFREPFIAQRYLPEVRKGDKRIILIDGRAVGAINRVPQEGESRSNMHVGGKPEPVGAHPEGPGNLRRHRPRSREPRPDLRRHRRHRRLPDRDQRDLAHRHPRGQALRRRRHRRAVLGRGRAAAPALTGEVGELLCRNSLSGPSGALPDRERGKRVADAMLKMVKIDLAGLKAVYRKTAA